MLFRSNTAKYFDEVVYCEVRNKKHVAASATTYANNILTGSRSGTILESTPGEANLVSIFISPSQSIKPTPTGNTPATKAATDLQALAATLRKGS